VNADALDVLTGWRDAARLAYAAKADALAEALVALDAIGDLIPLERRADVRHVLAILRDEIQECRAASEEGAP